MAKLSQPVQGRPARTAVMVMDTGSDPTLCPFFANCDGILIVDPETDTREFLNNGIGSREHLCSTIVDAKVERLVCGYIGKDATEALRAAGIDVRLGSCSCSVDDLVANFDSLPTP